MKTKKIKCEFTIEELYVLRHYTKKQTGAYKRKIRKEFAGEDISIGKHIQDILVKNLKTPEEWEVVNAKWRKIRDKYKPIIEEKDKQANEVKEPKKKTKTKPIPRTRVWRAEDDE